jgi:hypothetical protein
LKIRQVLNYKKVPYAETFLSYPDIVTFADQFGIAYDIGYEPPRPTLPAILVYNAKGDVVKAMSNSRTIAEYLDGLYPTSPVTRQIDDTAFRTAINPAWTGGLNIVIPTIPSILDDRGAKWFIADRSQDPDYHKSPLE